MNYLFALFVVSMVEGAPKYTHIETYDSRYNCELNKEIFKVVYEESLTENDEVLCLKVDEI
jgi:hypothetical protein